MWPDSDDPTVARLAAQIDRKGWFTAQTRAEAIAGKERARSEARAKWNVIGRPFLIADMALNMIPIQPGKFQMGAAGVAEPITIVTITTGFWLGKTEVTQTQWQAVMGTNPSSFKGPDLPVEQVSWDEAMEFCRKLTERERAAGRLPLGFSYTLPTEAQWEYACRAGTTGDYAGDLNAMAWFDQNSGVQYRYNKKLKYNEWVSGTGSTHAVAMKQPNAWGLYDMHGNVWEWCADWYGDYPSGERVDYSGVASGSFRVYRGGGWYFTAASCRSAFRDWFVPGVRGGVLGFRLALSSVP